MRHTSVCGLLLLCVHFYFVNTASSSHNIQRLELNPKEEQLVRMGTQMKVSPTWYLSVGDTVVINCTTHADRQNNNNKMDLQLVWTKMGLGERTKKVLVSQRASTGISYELGPVTHEHQGVYTCDYNSSLPDVDVHHDWHYIIWVADVSPRASIAVISHNRNLFLNGETFTVSCQLPNDNTQWKMMRFDNWLGNITECPNQVFSRRRLSCTTRSEYPWSDVLYWCENPAGERSNALNITTTDIQRLQISPKEEQLIRLGRQMKVSPTWYLSVGDTVVINCTTDTDRRKNNDKMDLQLVWTKMGLGEGTKKVLVSQRASTGISYVLGPVTHEHQGVYTCDYNSSLPDVDVHHDWHYIIWVADVSPRASIAVISHKRSQFLNGETFTVSCQLPDNDTQWKMMRFDEWVGNITECPNQVSADGHLSCTTRSEYPWSDVLYWCESPAGERSNALNITTTGSVRLALESPSLHVLEGEDLVLRCLLRDIATKKFTSNFRAFFYKNNFLVRYVTDGTLTLTAVTKINEGLYKCHHPEVGLSYETWITVKARPDEDQKKKSDIKTS